MSNFTIRAATEADIGRIAEIYSDAVENGTASYELVPPDVGEMRSRFAGLVAGGFPYLVAEAGGIILGYAYAGPFRPRPAYRFIVENSVYIAPEAKGKGVGSALLARLVADVEALGFRQIIAVIGDGRPDSPSVRLHAKLGFRHAGMLEGSGYKHGRWLDTTFMQYAMNGGKEIAPDPTSMPERRFQEPRRQPA